MTNYEYIVNNLTEQDVHTLLCGANRYSDSNIIARAFHAWYLWADSRSGGRLKSNCDKESFNYWIFEQYLGDDVPPNKKPVGRKQSLSISVWLSLQYNPEDWTKH